MRNIWLPVAILAIFLLISIAALAGLGRNIAQKRDAYSDPLCKAFMDKTPQAVDNMAAKNPGEQEKNKEEHGMARPEAYRAAGKNVSSKYRIAAGSGINQSMKIDAPRAHQFGQRDFAAIPPTSKQSRPETQTLRRRGNCPSLTPKHLRWHQNYLGPRAAAPVPGQ